MVMPPGSPYPQPGAPFPQPGAPYPQPGAPYPQAPTKIPGVVLAAGIIWIVFGGLGILGGVMSLGAGASGIAQLGIAVAFLIAGIQTVTGKAKDTLGNAIGSFIIAGLGLLGTLVLSSIGGRLGGDFIGVLVMIAVINCGALVTAGILALVGRERYRAWRATR
jgi:hypothetical protein